MVRPREKENREQRSRLHPVLIVCIQRAAHDGRRKNKREKEGRKGGGLLTIEVCSPIDPMDHHLSTNGRGGSSNIFQTKGKGSSTYAWVRLGYEHHRQLGCVCVWWVKLPLRSWVTSGGERENKVCNGEREKQGDERGMEKQRMTVVPFSFIFAPIKNCSSFSRVAKSKNLTPSILLLLGRERRLLCCCCFVGLMDRGSGVRTRPLKTREDKSSRRLDRCYFHLRQVTRL